MSDQMQRYTVKRYIIEEYEAWGNSRKEAQEYAAINDDPHTVTVTKETVVKDSCTGCDGSGVITEFSLNIDCPNCNRNF